MQALENWENEVFFNTSHIWLQNITFIVSFFAGCIAIYASIKKLSK